MRFLSTLLASALGTLLALGLIAFLLFFFVISLALSTDTTPAVGSGSVLVVELDGGIPETIPNDPFAEAFGGLPAYDLRDLTRTLDMAAADERVEAVWLQVGGVSSSWAVLEEVRAALERYKASGKALYASADDRGMSEAGYFLASVADSVYGAPQSFFEFNGFYLTAEFYQGTLEKLNVEPQIVRAGRYKAAAEPFLRDDLSPANREQLGALLESQRVRFMETVAESRDTTPETLQRLTEESAVLTAEDAVAEGLLDALLYRDQITDRIKARLGVEADDDLRTLSVSRYADVPADDAGLTFAEDGTIAVVYAEGQIMSGDGDGVFGDDGMLYAEDLIEAMDEARTSESVDAVVLRINSPGGSAAASEAMRRAIERTAAVKPVVVSMGGLAASGGYWIATAGDPLIADPLTITGSIGVVSVLFDASGFFDDKLGVTFDQVSTSPYADLFSALQPLSEGERQLLERSTEQTYQAFLEKVAASQNLSTAQVDSLGQGRVWSGMQALEVGLVDSLGTLEDAVAVAAQRAGLGEGPYRTRTLPRPRTVLEELTRSMSTQARTAWTRWATTPAERTLLHQRRFLGLLAREHGTVQALLPYDLRIE